MSLKCTESLTPDEALRAISFDLHSYGPQEELFCSLFVALGEAGARLGAQGGSTGVLIGSSVHEERFIPMAAVPERLCALLLESEPTASRLAQICSMVFETPARSLYSPEGPGETIELDTGMEFFACTRCGHCCLRLEVHDDCSELDVERWRVQGREDILRYVAVEEAPEGRRYRIWKRPGTPFFMESCPFLRRVPGDRAFYCAINDVKPDVCRAYPGLRKHAMMTGCKGFSSD